MAADRGVPYIRQIVRFSDAAGRVVLARQIGIKQTAAA
jgi:hypothetical protein